MNKPIRTMSVFCMLLFLALLGNVTYLQYIRAASLNEDPRNRRVIDASFSRARGAIVVDGDRVIADSRASDDRYKFRREYPEPRTYSAITGYFSFDSQTGLEQSQNPVLSGDDPRLFVTRLVDLVNSNSPEGGRVEVTVDSTVQGAAYAGLDDVAGDVEGAVVALEPKTGRILAMASLPTYDPNDLAVHDRNGVAETYRDLLGDPREPLLNRAIQTRLPPGSTFKLITASAALESGRYSGADSEVPGGPVYRLPQSSAKIDNGGRSCGDKKTTMSQALAQSCNTTFLAIADELGADALRDQAEAYGFNRDYLDDLRPQAQSVYPDDADAPQTALSGIGQWDVAATPLQMAMVAGAIANDGVVMKPYLVEKVLSPNLDTLDRIEPQELSTATSPETAKKLTDMMVTTVTSGTGANAAIPGVDVAGKTGTAENCEGCKNYAWFVSFAPADDPQVAVAVMIQGSDIPADLVAGGALGAPVAKRVMQAVLDR
jgi:penicillin-binding protein A